MKGEKKGKGENWPVQRYHDGSTQRSLADKWKNYYGIRAAAPEKKTKNSGGTTTRVHQLVLTKYEKDTRHSDIAENREVV